MRERFKDRPNNCLRSAEGVQVFLKPPVQLERLLGREAGTDDHVANVNGMRQHGFLGEFFERRRGIVVVHIRLSPHIYDEGVEGDGFLNVAREKRREIVHLRGCPANPFKGDGAGDGVKLGADIGVADIASFSRHEQVAQQSVEHLDVELEAVASAPADGFGDREPGGERGEARSNFHEEDRKSVV